MYSDNPFSKKAGIMQVGLGSPISDAPQHDFPSPRRRIEGGKQPVMKTPEKDGEEPQQDYSSPVSTEKSVKFTIPGMKKLEAERKLILR